jgi:dienelactone hydrolase
METIRIGRPSRDRRLARWSARLMGMAVSALAIGSSPGQAQTFTTQIYPVQTVTVTGQQFLTAGTGKPAVIAGELRVPSVALERIPAVVIVHGGVGVGDHEDHWARELNGIGVAAFILDSFSGRAVGDTRANLDQLSALASLDDSYRALELLSKHPRIDPCKIAIMGFSRGAIAAVYASSKRFQAAHSSPGTQFAAYIGFYTPCGTTYIGDGDVSEKPIRLFHGASDDWVPVQPCEQYVERLRKAGKDVTLTVYPGAFHRFDDLGLKAAVFLPQGQTPRRCALEEHPEGKLVHQGTALPFTPGDPCLERGVTVAPNAAAQVASLAAVKSFLSHTFGLH